MAELGIAASIIAVIQMTGTVTQHLASVKGATKDRQNILNELSTVTGILFVLKDQADEAEHDGSWDTTLRALNMPNGPLEQFKAALETLTTKLAPVDGLKKIRKALIWPFQEKEIRDILSTIERQKGLFNLARQNDHLVLTKAIKNDVMSIQDGVDEIGKNIARIQISDHQREIISWLSAPDPSLNYNNALKARNPNTGTWLIESEVVHRWMLHGGFVSMFGLVGSVKILLEQGYDADTKLQLGYGQYSALCVACVEGHASNVQLLLDNGAVVNGPVLDLFKGLEWGTMSRKLRKLEMEELMSFLLDHSTEANAGDMLYVTALQAASFTEHEEIVQLLLDNGADINAKGGYYGSALHAASCIGSREIVRLLIENGADVNAQAGLWNTALQAASGEDFCDTMRLLLEAGADVNLQGGVHGSALQSASFCGSDEAAQLLIEHGADVNAQGDMHPTALRSATRAKHRENGAVKLGFSSSSEDDSDVIDYQSESDSDRSEHQSANNQGTYLVLEGAKQGQHI